MQELMLNSKMVAARHLGNGETQGERRVRFL